MAIWPLWSLPVHGRLEAPATGCQGLYGGCWSGVEFSLLESSLVEEKKMLMRMPVRKLEKLELRG